MQMRAATSATCSQHAKRGQCGALVAGKRPKTTSASSPTTTRGDLRLAHPAYQRVCLVRTDFFLSQHAVATLLTPVGCDRRGAFAAIVLFSSFSCSSTSCFLTTDTESESGSMSILTFDSSLRLMFYIFKFVSRNKATSANASSSTSATRSAKHALVCRRRPPTSARCLWPGVYDHTKPRQAGE